MQSHSVRLVRVALAGAMLLSPSLLRAQAVRPASTSAHLVGMVKDSSGNPLNAVEIWVRGTDFFAHSNDAGGFRLPELVPGPVKLLVRRLGYEQANVDLELRPGRTDSLVISLSAVAANLPGVTVEEESRVRRILAGFYDRRSKGFGHFFTRAEIEEKRPHDFTDIVRTTPGVSILTISGRRQVRFSRSAANPRGDCPPQYWIDGMRIENASADEFPPGDIEGIEIYAGTATIPSQFAPRAVQIQKTCGAIVIWTRVPGT